MSSGGLSYIMCYGCERDGLCDQCMAHNDMPLVAFGCTVLTSSTMAFLYCIRSVRPCCMCPVHPPPIAHVSKSCHPTVRACLPLCNSTRLPQRREPPHKVHAMFQYVSAPHVSVCPRVISVNTCDIPVPHAWQLHAAVAASSCRHPLCI